MANSENEKGRYLEEAAIVLGREGFHVEKVEGDRLDICWEGKLLCEAMLEGGIAYRRADISTPEREAAKNRAYEIVSTVARYMYLMETAPFLEAAGLEERYKVLADFNGVVLAGCPSKYGAQFVVWEWDYAHKGVCYGNYFTGLYSPGNYDQAKRTFAVRSGLVPKQLLFQDDQLIEIYRCCTDTLQGGFELTGNQEKTIQRVRDQIEQYLPDILERIQAHDREPEQMM